MVFSVVFSVVLLQWRWSFVLKTGVREAVSLQGMMLVACVQSDLIESHCLVIVATWNLLLEILYFFHYLVVKSSIGYVSQEASFWCSWKVPFFRRLNYEVLKIFALFRSTALIVYKYLMNPGGHDVKEKFLSGRAFSLKGKLV